MKVLWGKVVHPVNALDTWWLRKSSQRRLDRNAIGICALFGFVGPTLSVILVGPAPSSALSGMPDGLQISMCVCIVVGLLTMLYGALSGFPWWFPNTPIRRSYAMGYTGAPAAVIGLGVYAYFIIMNTQTWSSALSAVLTPVLALGISIQAFTYWLEVRRIEAVEDRVLATARIVVDDEHRDDT